MLTTEKLIFFLALQKILSIKELVDELNLTEQDIDDINERFKRQISKQTKSTIKKSYFAKIKHEEILLFITTNNVGIDEIIENFNILKEELVEFINFNLKRFPELQFLIKNKDFINEIKQIKKENENHLIRKNRKKIKNNEENIILLKEMSKNKGIEEIAAYFNLGPMTIRKEQIFLKIGGYWNNENIRKSRRFVTEASDKFGIEEIIYLINYRHDFPKKKLADKLNTSEKNLNIFLELLEICEQNYSKDDLMELLINHLFELERYTGKEELKKLVNFERDNSQFLYKSDEMQDYIFAAEAEIIEKYYEDFFKELEEINREKLEQHIYTIYYLENNKVKIEVGYIEEEKTDCFKIQTLPVNLKGVTTFMKEDILALK